jgi:hypothetical protein
MYYVKTEVGQQALKSHDRSLSPKQRTAFILFDGKRSVQDVLRSVAGMGVVQTDIDDLVARGFLATANGSNYDDTVKLVTQPTLTSVERYQKAYPLATQLTASLGLRGFRLNLAVETADSYEKLLELAPKIRAAVGDDKFKPLGLALSD